MSAILTLQKLCAAGNHKIMRLQPLALFVGYWIAKRPRTLVFKQLWCKARCRGTIHGINFFVRAGNLGLAQAIKFQSFTRWITYPGFAQTGSS